MALFAAHALAQTHTQTHTWYAVAPRGRQQQSKSSRRRGQRKHCAVASLIYNTQCPKSALAYRCPCVCVCTGCMYWVCVWVPACPVYLFSRRLAYLLWIVLSPCPVGRPHFKYFNNFAPLTQRVYVCVCARVQRLPQHLAVKYTNEFIVLA